MNFIEPIFKWSKKPFDFFQTGNPYFWLCAVLIIASSALFAVMIGKYASNRLKGNQTKVCLAYVAIIVIYSTLLIAFFGIAAVTFKGIILALILLFASYSDLKTRLCDDYIHLMILIAAFIGLDYRSIPSMILAAGFVMGILLLTVFTTHSKIGGADIKLAVTCSFLLGFKQGLIGFLGGMILAILVNLIRKNKKGFPMIPYLAVGYLTAVFI